MLVLYWGYSFSLAMWTCASVQNTAMEAKGIYLKYFFITAIVGFVCCMCFKKKSKNKVGILMALVLSNMGASIAFRVGEESMQEYLKDTYLMIVTFILVYLVVRYTRIYQKNLINWVWLMLLPCSLFGARIFGEPKWGSYIYFCGVLVFGLVLMFFPFVVAHFMSEPENKYRNGNVTHLSLNMVKLLVYTFILFVGCVVCNEFGLLLVLGVSATIVFFVRCKNNITKLFYTITCMSGVVIACKFISHINDRILIWINPVEAYYNQDLAGKAESVLYLFRNFKRMGWWGNGIGNLPKSIYPTLDTDHVVVTLINDYSIFVAILIILTGILYIKYLLLDGVYMNIYDRYLNLCSAVIVGLIIAINVASSLGSFITAGIGFPWVSNGGSVNVMLTVLLATHCGMMERKVKTYVGMQG